MKKGIHPKYYPEAKVICACGNTWTTGSTQEVIRTEMCSVCHPFFTGEQRIVDTAGQVDRFQRRMERADQIAQEQASRRQTKKKKQEETLFEFVTEDNRSKLEAALAEVAATEAEAEPVTEVAAVAEATTAVEAKPKRSPRPRAKAKAKASREASDDVAEAKTKRKKARKPSKAQTAASSAAESPSEPAGE